MIEIKGSLGRSLTTLSLLETFPRPPQRARKTSQDGLEIGLLLNKQADFYLQCTSKYGKHISRPVWVSIQVRFEKSVGQKKKKEKEEDPATPNNKALEKRLEVLHLSGTEWNQFDAPHSPRAAGWQQPRALGASVKCQQLIKEQRAACGIRKHSSEKINFTKF